MKSWCNYKQWITFNAGILRRVTLLVLIFLKTMDSAAVQAAPVTFRFDAEIDTVFPGIPFDSGIEFAEGDVISGRFTFEPDDGDGGMFFETTQPYDFKLSINDVELSASSFEIEAFDNGVIADFPLATRIDSLEVAAGALTPLRPSKFPNINAMSGLRIQLWAGTSFLPGQMDVLETAMIPGDAATWNRFSLLRDLTVTLADGAGGVMGFRANLGEFSQIPEPPTLLIVSICLVLAGGFRFVATTRTIR